MVVVFRCCPPLIDHIRPAEFQGEVEGAKFKYGVAGAGVGVDPLGGGVGVVPLGGGVGGLPGGGVGVALGADGVVIVSKPPWIALFTMPGVCTTARIRYVVFGLRPPTGDEELNTLPPVPGITLRSSIPSVRIQKPRMIISSFAGLLTLPLRFIVKLLLAVLNVGPLTNSANPTDILLSGIIDW